MRKRAKLTQEQLKAVLQGWKTLLLACHAWDIGDYFSDEHVYTQIEELIEDSDLAAWMDKCHELGLEVVELREGLTVTREKIAQLAYSLMRDVDIDGCDDDEGFQEAVGDSGSTIEHWLKELGITVETIH